MEQLSQTTPQSFFPNSGVSAWPQEESALYTNAMQRLALMMEGIVCSPKVTAISPGQADHAGGNTFTITGQELIPYGWKQASKTILHGANPAALMTWTMIQPGAYGNTVTIEQVDGGAKAPTAVDWDSATKKITVTLDVGTGDTLANIVTALAGSITGAQYVVVADPGAHGAETADIETSSLLEDGLGAAFRRAFLMTGTVGGNNAVIWSARRPGSSQHVITVAFVEDLGAGGPTIEVEDYDIIVHSVAGGATAAQIVAAVNGSEDARALVAVRLPYGTTGANKKTAAVAAHLANGDDGTAVAICVGGIDGIVTAISETSITAEAAALTASAADDAALLELSVCGYTHAAWLVVI